MFVGLASASDGGCPSHGGGCYRRTMVRLLAIACLLLRATPSSACATAPPRGEEAKLADEDSLIIWDAKNHIEHFVRKAAFHTTAHAFGFLVPTPSVPELAEMDD